MMTIREVSSSWSNKEAILDDQKFPEHLRKQLLDKLNEWEEFWCHADIKTVRVQDTCHLEVRLELTQRQLFISLGEYGTGFELIAPVYINFPKEASHFVLTDLGSSNETWRFFLLEDASEKGDQPHEKSEVLCARALMDFDAFLNSHCVFLPNLIAKLDEAEACVKAHIEGKPVSRFKIMA